MEFVSRFTGEYPPRRTRRKRLDDFLRLDLCQISQGGGKRRSVTARVRRSARSVNKHATRDARGNFTSRLLGPPWLVGQDVAVVGGRSPALRHHRTTAIMPKHW